MTTPKVACAALVVGSATDPIGGTDESNEPGTEFEASIHYNGSTLVTENGVVAE